MSKKTPTQERSFQDIENELLTLVEALEQPDTPLEQALADYEKGVGLLKEAQERLEAAEQKVRMLSPETHGQDDEGSHELDD